MIVGPLIAKADITPLSIKITWEALAIDRIGGDDIQYYMLEWDEGDSSKVEDANPWTELTSSSNGLSLEFT